MTARRRPLVIDRTWSAATIERQLAPILAWARSIVRHPDLATDDDRALAADLFEVWERRRIGQKGSARTFALAHVARVVDDALADRDSFADADECRAVLARVYADAAEQTRDASFDREPSDDAVQLASESYGTSGRGGRARRGSAWLAALVIVDAGAFGVKRATSAATLARRASDLTPAVTIARRDAPKLRSKVRPAMPATARKSRVRK